MLEVPERIVRPGRRSHTQLWLVVIKGVWVVAHRRRPFHLVRIGAGSCPTKFEAPGVSVRHASYGTVDMNGTPLNAIDTINATEEPTKKAALAWLGRLI